MNIKKFLQTDSKASSVRLVMLITAINANIIAMLTCITFIYISIINKSIDIGPMSMLILTLLGTAISGKVAQSHIEKDTGVVSGTANNNNSNSNSNSTSVESNTTL